ncbi:putative membrane protein [Bacillus clarus]|uniref:Putative membrane protein n=1 Tax=Bacillus clarus TaxID=2338372 RepID=A0A090YZJ9_9BACI|nr:putative membrane protein [Bacillus clarus]
MFWLGCFVGYCVGMSLCLLLMIQFIKAKEVD